MVAFPAFTKFFRNLPYGQKVDNKPMAFAPKGTSGTEIYSGQFDEEYLSKLFAEKGIEVFDEMRRSDGMVKMLLSVVKNPIKSASWTVEAVDDSEEEKEIAAFVEHILFKDISTKSGKRKTFQDFISEALTAVEFGFSAFEIVHKVVKGHKRFGDYLGIADLGFRHQRSVIEWRLRDDGMIDFIRQLVNGDLGVDATIPGQHLLVFNVEKEGDNYAGISMLRPCYGAWFRKNIYRKLQAIGIERAAKGVPIGTIPTEMLGRDDYETQRAAFQALIDRLSAHEKNGIVLGAGYDIKELKLSHDADKVQKAIDSEDVEMALAFVASFMMLGIKGNSGSFALGTDLSAIFLGGIQNIGYSMCEKINMHVLEPILRAKYGERDEYPQLCVSGIADKAGKAFSETISALLTSGAVQKSPALQRHVHKLFDLPEVDDALAEKELENRMNPPQPTLPNDPSGKKPDMPEDKKKLHEDCNHAVRLSEDQRKEFPVSAFIEDKADALTAIMRAGLRKRADDMLAEMTRLIQSGASRQDVLNITMPDDKAYATALKEWAGAAAQDALDGVLSELGKSRKEFQFADQLKKLDAATRDKIITDILLTAGYQADDLEKAVYFSFNESFGRVPEETLLSGMSQAVERQMEKTVIETAAVNMSAKVTNKIREDVFFSDGVLDEIESFVFLNPDPISLICQSLVGRVFTKEEYETTSFSPPLHHNCKSFIAAQTLGDKTNKPLTAGGLTVTDPAVLKTKTL